MKKYLLFLVLLSSARVMGQSSQPVPQFVKYDAYYRDIQQWLQSWKQEVPHTTLGTIKSGTSKLLDDAAPESIVVKTINAAQKALDDEAVFEKRKGGVYIVGRLMATEINSVITIDFDLIGTAFSISADGVCVSNYHVLKNIFHPEDPESKKDSLYFIITAGKKLYLLDKVLAYSRNNDLAVFKVNMQGDKLDPVPLGKPANIGATVYCLSNPGAHFYSFSKGIVARNTEIDAIDAGPQYNPKGRPPIRMEITADYGVGSSGGPILDRFGNLAGIVISTTPIAYTEAAGDGKQTGYIQMMVKNTAPVKALTDLLKR
ncbi:MAG: serine protease [Sphingobacteriaceae bacterium]|nr:MAG: serine protease [Sphingobacteriaceae bacterium]